MAEILLSPGISVREQDKSQVSGQPVQAGAAIIGPTVKGPVELPTLVGSYSQYVNKFGDDFISGSDVFSYFTSIAAYNYFNNGGDTLLVARVVSGSYTSATSTVISSSLATSTFTLKTISKGIVMNNTGAMDSTGALTSGSMDNIRWEIISPNTASGTFGLIIRQGNDITNSKTVLESFTNLSLDPKSNNFVSRVIGDYVYSYNPSTVQVDLTGSYTNNSSFVYVSSVDLLTPDYLDNSGVAKNQYTASIPLAASGAFFGATGNIKGNAQFYNNINNTDTQGLVASNYTNMINLLSNKDDYRFNLLIAPGLIDAFASHTSAISNIVLNTQQRGDNMFVLDPVGYGATSTSTITQAASRDTSYAASYWPWCQILDPSSGKNVWVPTSVMIAGVYAYNDRVSEPWFAPAGINRGGLGTVIRVEQKLNQSTRDALYTGKVNPIASFPGQGIVVYGQKTLQTKASALDRVNVRRLLIELKSYISQVANTLLFEQNSTSTRNTFLGQVNPYLSSVQQRQGLYAFKVVMDETNNTADVIDRNQMVGAIYVQPTKTAEFIYLDFIITPTGATFPA
jgi:phage tail sheath protein FI